MTTRQTENNGQRRESQMLLGRKQIEMDGWTIDLTISYAKFDALAPPPREKYLTEVNLVAPNGEKGDYESYDCTPIHTPPVFLGFGGKKRRSPVDVLMRHLKESIEVSNHHREVAGQPQGLSTAVVDQIREGAGEWIGTQYETGEELLRFLKDQTPTLRIHENDDTAGITMHETDDVIADMAKGRWIRAWDTVDTEAVR